MPWSETMSVEVGYEISEEPTDAHLQSLRQGAETLTDDKRSIETEQRAHSDHHVLVVRFTMRRLAQHKVVGDIHHQFKLSFASHHLYDDSWITFPKDATRSHSRRRR